MGVDQPPRAGVLLRAWRLRRKLSQLELALRADTSSRHLSCVETGRARPSQKMVLRLAHHLDVPLRERNSLLIAAGYAPVYRERPLDGEDMCAVRSAVDMLLEGHEPYPAVVVDRLGPPGEPRGKGWAMTAASAGLARAHDFAEDLRIRDGRMRGETFRPRGRRVRLRQHLPHPPRWPAIFSDSGSVVATVVKLDCGE
ncbi:helix-turn-helix domain-containing protein [Streptomyces sp. NPDC018045]|uniref:helix-turn-helix domain-containing protein n=1 Tax=Streptomyces sp. NPDC018045 TaxID=3365037 RepID=UPI0037AB6C32